MGFWENIAIDAVEEKNKYIEDTEKGMELLIRLLSSKTDAGRVEERLQYLDKLIESDYMEFIKKVDLPNEAETYNQMIKARTVIDEIVRFPFLGNKKVVAVGGGFSAGKSLFINSILRDDILPTDTRPTTSIPTYIAKGNSTNIYVLNIFGNKNKINREAVQAISHLFSKKYNLSFTQIIKNIILQSNKMPYSNIAFLDTPGYTKSDYYKKEDNTDENVARMHLKVADYLIWVIDIEKGTIPFEDLEFIKSLKFQNPIFFIFNKADKKEPSEINKIIQISEEYIKKSGIKIEGITAYSSFFKKEYGDEKLFSFLKELNKIEKEVDVYQEFDKVFDRYSKYLKDSINEEKEKLKLLNKIALFSNLKEERDVIKNLVVKSQNKVKMQKGLLEELGEISRSFYSSINSIVKGLDETIQIEVQNSIIENTRERFVNEIISNIRSVEDSFKEQCNILKESFNIEDLKEEAIRDEIIVSQVEEEVNLCKWYNPFLWSKTKTVIRDVPEVKKVSYRYISVNNVYSSLEKYYKDVSDKLKNHTDMVLNISLDIDTFTSEYDKKLINQSYIKNNLEELLEEIKKTMSYQLDEIHCNIKIDKTRIFGGIGNEIITENSFCILYKLLEMEIENIINKAIEQFEDRVYNITKEIYALLRG